MDKILKEPLISVVMPVYNCANYISTAIESILNQTYFNFELLIIDDQSTDGTAQIISGYTDGRIKLIIKDANSGLVDSLNLGLNCAKGYYIARMDGDDISWPNRFQKQVDFLTANPDVVLCGTALQLNIKEQAEIRYPTNHNELKLALLDYCAIAHPTVMIRSDFLKTENLRYHPDYICAEDYELWTRLIWKGQIANLPDVLLTYRVHADQFSTTNKLNQIKNSFKCRINMLQKIWPASSETDSYMHELFFETGFVKNITNLNNMLDWLDNLISKNETLQYFEVNGFKLYIITKKLNFTRGFYLNQTPYNPVIFFRFIKSWRKYAGYFNRVEKLKMGLKCMLFWKSVIW